MARFFTADFHLGSEMVLKTSSERPWKTVDEMNEGLIEMCNSIAGPGDVIIHVGDLFCHGNDRGTEGSKLKPEDFISRINANFVNIQGNHDVNNGVRSVAYYLRTNLGKVFKDVSISHYPSFSTKANGQWRKGDLHLCGHVHHLWKENIDIVHRVLNINVGVDVWNYKLVSESELIDYVRKYMVDSLRKQNPELSNGLSTLVNQSS